MELRVRDRAAVDEQRRVIGAPARRLGQPLVQRNYRTQPDGDPGVDREAGSAPHPARGRVAGRRRVRRHPLRGRRRHRQDHDRPPRGPQRLPARDRGRAVRRVRPRPRGHRDRRDRAHRRGPARLLLGRGPACPWRLRLRRRRSARRPLPRNRSSFADAAAAEADRGDGRRLRDRRRTRAARGLRPDDRRRQRPLRTDRAAGRQLRRRLRGEPAGGTGRSEAGEGDLVLVPPIRRRRGARHGPRERGRPVGGARGGDRAVVPGDAGPLPLLVAAIEGQLQRRRRWARGRSAARARCQPALLHERGGAGGAERVQGEATARFREVPEATVSRAAAVPRGTLRLWLVAARPRTLPAAIAPVLVGTALAGAEDVFRPLPFFAALVGSVFIQIGTNLSNDYSDARRGADTEERLGPVRVTAGGLMPPKRVLVGTYVAFGVAVAAGLYLAAVAGWELLVVGTASILAGVLYTGGPKPYGYEGLGELFVFLFFGIVAVAGSYYVQVKHLNWEAFALAVPVGLLAAAILVVNNFRDIDTDRRAGKRTLAVRLGRQRTRVMYAAMVYGAYLLTPVTWLFGPLKPWLLLPWLTLPIAARVVRVVRNRTDGPSLNQALAQ